LIAFVLVLASWTALHAFGPEPRSTQSEIVYLTVLIVAATFGIGATDGGRASSILIKIAWRRIAKQ
jgi:hypothetical protein